MRKILKKKLQKGGAVVLLFLIIFTVTFTLNRLYIKKNTDMVNVVVAAKKIPAFSLLTIDQVKLAKRPNSVVPKEAIIDTNVLSDGNKYYATDLGFGSGDIIRTDRISEEISSKENILASLENENKILISIDTNLVKSCANIVSPGTLVNVIVFIKGQMIEEPDMIISPVEDPRLANLLVIDKKNSESSPISEKGREAIPAVVTFLMDKENLEGAKALVQYNEIGSVYLLPVGFKGDIYLASQAIKQ